MDVLENQHFLFSLLDLQTLNAQNGLVGGFCVLCVVLNVISVVQFSFILLSESFGSCGPKIDFGKTSLGLILIFHLVVGYGTFWLSRFRHSFVCCPVMPEFSILLTRSDGRVGKPTLFYFLFLIFRL